MTRGAISVSLSILQVLLTLSAEHSRAKVDDLEGGQLIGGYQHEV